MVFNLIFHIIWYSVKGINALIRWARARYASVDDDPASYAASSSATTTRVAVRRPTNDGVGRLFVTFALSFTIIHQLVHTVLGPPAGLGAVVPPMVEAKTCVETDENNFFCTDDPKEARRRARKTAAYYLANFGVPQTIEGSGEENRRMREVADEMEEYFRGWVATYDHVESLKEKCINKHDKCVFWASIGECTQNPGYMENDCMMACQICEKLLQTPESEGKSEL